MDMTDAYLASIKEVRNAQPSGIAERFEDCLECYKFVTPIRQRIRLNI